MCNVRWIRSLAFASAIVACHAAAAETGLDDPTRPSHASAPVVRDATPGWRVDSILVSTGRRLAVINGRVVAVDDRVDGARVVEILPYQVTIEYRGRLRQVALVPTRVKRPAD